MNTRLLNLSVYHIQYTDVSRRMPTNFGGQISLVWMYVWCMYDVCMMYVCMYVYMYVVCMYVCMYVCICVCVYVLCMYVCMYVCVLCVCVCVWNVTSTQDFGQREREVRKREILNIFSYIYILCIEHSLLRVEVTVIKSVVERERVRERERDFYVWRDRHLRYFTHSQRFPNLNIYIYLYIVHIEHSPSRVEVTVIKSIINIYSDFYVWRDHHLRYLTHIRNTEREREREREKTQKRFSKTITWKYHRLRI